MGTLDRPPNMKRAFAAWLTMASMDSAMKSMNMISTTGFNPVMAAPTPMDAIVASEIGVSRTRASPNVSCRPWVTLNTPPAMATSSPNTTTLSSSCIVSCKALLTARKYLISTMSPSSVLKCVNVIERIGKCRVDILACRVKRLRHAFLDAVVNGLDLVFSDAIIKKQLLCSDDRLMLGNGSQLIAVAILLRIALIVTTNTMRHTFQHRRTITAAHPLDQLFRTFLHIQHITAIGMLIRQAKGCRQVLELRDKLAVGG